MKFGGFRVKFGGKLGFKQRIVSGCAGHGAAPTDQWEKWEKMGILVKLVNFWEFWSEILGFFGGVLEDLGGVCVEIWEI